MYFLNLQKIFLNLFLKDKNSEWSNRRKRIK